MFTFKARSMYPDLPIFKLPDRLTQTAYNYPTSLGNLSENVDYTL